MRLGEDEGAARSPRRSGAPDKGQNAMDILGQLSIPLEGRLPEGMSKGDSVHKDLKAYANGGRQPHWGLNHKTGTQLVE